MNVFGLRMKVLAFAALVPLALAPAIARAQSADRDDYPASLRDVLQDIAAGRTVSARVSLPLTAGFFDGKPSLYITPEVGVDPSAGSAVVQAAQTLAKNLNANFIPQNFRSLPNSPAVDDFFVFSAGNQGNVLASSPNPTGPANTDLDYSPLWQISTVSFNPGRTPRVLTSQAAIQAAQAAGDVTVTKTPIIVECSVIFTPRGGLLPAARVFEAKRDGDDRR